MQKAGMTVREFIAELEQVSDDLKDKEFVVRSANTGFRTVFPNGAARLNYSCIVGGRFVLEFVGTQDDYQILR